jgi:hypothetical protein
MTAVGWTLTTVALVGYCIGFFVGYIVRGRVRT